jgi:hypothetical protein
MAAKFSSVASSGGSMTAAIYHLGIPPLAEMSEAAASTAFLASWSSLIPGSMSVDLATASCFTSMNPPSQPMGWASSYMPRGAGSAAPLSMPMASLSPTLRPTRRLGASLLKSGARIAAGPGSIARSMRPPRKREIAGSNPRPGGSSLPLDAMPSPSTIVQYSYIECAI